jgi:hypothetical protein
VVLDKERDLARLAIAPSDTLQVGPAPRGVRATDLAEAVFMSTDGG